MQVTDLFGTEIQLSASHTPNQECKTLLEGIANGSILLLLAIEATEGWEARIAPLKLISAASGREIMAYVEAGQVLLWMPFQEAAQNTRIREELKEAFIRFIHLAGIVPQGKVIPIN